MTDDDEPVIFSVVGADGSTDASDHRRPGASGDTDEGLPLEQREDYLGSGRFPLAGPIVDNATSRQLKGKCSSCESKLRIRVREDGPIKVRCPVCGHARTVDL